LTYIAVGSTLSQTSLPTARGFLMKKLHLKLYLKNGKIKDYFATRFIRRILATVSLVQFKKAYIKVSYGKDKCVMACVCEFYNDGYYFNKDDLRWAIKAFWNES
jgi:hypothetical protein